MVFVMDVSGSIGGKDFTEMKRWAKRITNNFVIGPERTRVGWISFNHQAWVAFRLDRFLNRESVQWEIDHIPYDTGYTAIGRALETLRLGGFDGGRNSFDVPEVAIVVTDGYTNWGIKTNIAAERLRRGRNVNVFVVGVGDKVNTTELALVAGAGIEDTQDHMYHIRNFDQLGTLQRRISARACFGKSLSPTFYNFTELCGFNT